MVIKLGFHGDLTNKTWRFAWDFMVMMFTNKNCDFHGDSRGVSLGFMVIQSQDIH